MIRYLNFPQIPPELISTLSKNVDDYQTKGFGLPYQSATEYYWWSDDNNEKINAWCKENISRDMYFAFQFMKNLPIHKDVVTKVKLSYIVDPGGDDVTTTFYDEKRAVTHSYVIEPLRWHVLNVGNFHSVSNVSGQRFSVTGRIFPE